MTRHQVPPHLQTVIGDGLQEAVRSITDAGIQPDVFAEYRPRRRILFWHRRPRFHAVGKGWRLGVFLLDENGTLFAGGETTRGIHPNHPGHVSHERERRRTLTEAAYRSGFRNGEVIHYGGQPIDWASGELDTDGPLWVAEGKVLVRWSPGAANVAPRDFIPYLQEQLELFLEYRQ